MTAPETPLELAARHVAEGEVRAARQKRQVGEMRRDGHSDAALTAEKLLRSFETALALAREHLRKEWQKQDK